MTDDVETAPAMGPSSMRRLSQAEYEATVRDLLGVTISAAGLPADAKDPFDSDPATQLVSPALISALETLAQKTSEALLAQPSLRDSVVGCAPKGPDDAACFRSFITTFGRRAYRHPLPQSEIDELMTLQSLAVESGDFYTGVDSVLRVVFQDPQFVYRVEIGAPIEGQPGAAKLPGWEVATRLSYFLWGSTPDDALLDAAAQGKLGDATGIAAEAKRMLADRRARARFERFHALWLGYDKPALTPLTQAMRKESDALVDRVVFDEQRTWTDLFTSNEAWLDDTLASHYGMLPPGKPGWVDVSQVSRAGVLSEASFLSVANKFSDTSPTQRGKFIQERILCTPIPPPPPNVKADAPPSGTAVCKADRYAEHRQGGCQGCHALLDGVGNGLEQYDEVGRFRKVEKDAPQCAIDGRGEVPGVGTFKGPAELGALLAGSPLLDTCLVKQIFRFANGQRETADDDAIVQHVLAKFLASGARFEELLLAFVTEDAFRFRRWK